MPVMPSHGKTPRSGKSQRKGELFQRIERANARSRQLNAESVGRRKNGFGGDFRRVHPHKRRRKEWGSAWGKIHLATWRDIHVARRRRTEMAAGQITEQNDYQPSSNLCGCLALVSTTGFKDVAKYGKDSPSLTPGMIRAFLFCPLPLPKQGATGKSQNSATVRRRNFPIELL
jgi:hypothetical protein